MLKVAVRVLFDPEDPNTEQVCSSVAVAACRLHTHDEWPEDVHILFTNQLGYANRDWSDDCIAFFFSDDKEAQAQVTNKSTVVVRDGLDHLPRQIVQAVRARFPLKAPTRGMICSGH